MSHTCINNILKVDLHYCHDIKWVRVLWRMWVLWRIEHITRKQDFFTKQIVFHPLSKVIRNAVLHISSKFGTILLTFH